MAAKSHPVKIGLFLAFADKDQRLCDTLITHLSTLERTDMIDDWHRYEIQPGSDWRKIKYERLTQADMILLGISPDFIASDHCYNVQMKKAIERQAAGDAYVVPLLLRPTSQQDYLPIAHLQWLPKGRPGEIKPISERDNKDRAFHEIVSEIEQVIRNLPEQFLAQREEAHHHWTPDIPYVSNQTRASTKSKTSTSTRGTCYLVYDTHTGWLGSVAWSSDGKRIASGGDDGAVRVWNATTGDTLLTYKGHVGMLSNIWRVAWSPDSTLITSSGNRTAVQVWYATSGQKIAAYKGHSHLLPIVYGLAWSPDGKAIASTSINFGLDQAVHIWKARTGDEIAKITIYRSLTASVGGVAWSPDSTHIAAGLKGEVRVFDVLTKKHLFTYKTGTDDIQFFICWSPDGKRLVSAGARQAQVWDIHSATSLHSYIDHKADIRDIAISLDGKYVASASNDTTVHIWKADTGEHIYTYPGHKDQVTTVTWSPDGTRIASGCKDGMVHVWQAI